MFYCKGEKRIVIVTGGNCKVKNVLFGFAFLTNPPEKEQLKFALQVGETIIAPMECGNWVLPVPTDLALYLFQPGDWMNLKTWKAGNQQNQLNPNWKDATW